MQSPRGWTAYAQLYRRYCVSGVLLPQGVVPCTSRAEWQALNVGPLSIWAGGTCPTWARASQHSTTGAPAYHTGCQPIHRLPDSMR
eukprot:COSAG01_NODE_1050_length_11922_cov_8.014632_2_plen_86_part_00